MLAPTLFSLYLTAVLETKNEGLNRGVFIRTRTDGKLFNLVRLRTHTNTLEMCVRELLYADDSALVVNNAVDMQQIVDRFSSAADMFGLNINISKTELLYQLPPMSIELPETITVHEEPLKTTESFTYPGSIVTNTNSADLEVERRIQSATKAYGGLQKRLWSCKDIITKTKVNVYSVAVIPFLLYSIQCTTLYRRHIMALTRLQLRHLRFILNIKWQDRIPDDEVLRRAHTVSVEALTTVSQLRWAGHVRRMANSRLPKAVFYSELSQGKRSHGGQKLRFKDVLKRHMKKTGISHDIWEEEAVQRVKWRGLLRKAKSAPAKLSACTCPTTLGSYFKQFQIQQLSALPQIPSGSDCPHESLFKIGLNSNTRQSSSTTKDSHYYIASMTNFILILFRCNHQGFSSD